MHDLLGSFLGDVAPRFVKRYAAIGMEIERAVRQYAAEVRDGEPRLSVASLTAFAPWGYLGHLNRNSYSDSVTTKRLGRARPTSAL